MNREKRRVDQKTVYEIQRIRLLVQMNESKEKKAKGGNLKRRPKYGSFLDLHNGYFHGQNEN